MFSQKLIVGVWCLWSVPHQLYVGNLIPGITVCLAHYHNDLLLQGSSLATLQENVRYTTVTDTELFIEPKYISVLVPMFCGRLWRSIRESDASFHAIIAFKDSRCVQITFIKWKFRDGSLYITSLFESIHNISANRSMRCFFDIEWAHLFRRTLTQNEFQLSIYENFIILLVFHQNFDSPRFINHLQISHKYSNKTIHPKEICSFGNSFIIRTYTKCFI